MLQVNSKTAFCCSLLVVGNVRVGCVSVRQSPRTIFFFLSFFKIFVLRLKSVRKLVWMWEGQEAAGALINSRRTAVGLLLSLGCWCSSYVISGMCAYVCLSQHAESAPLGPWSCAQGASSSPAVRSGALTWPVPLAHSERLTRRAQRSAWPTFPWRSFCWAAALLSGGGGSEGGAALRLLCCPGVLNHRHLFADTYQCVCAHFFRCVGGIPQTHTGLCWGWIRGALWGLQVDAGQHLGRTPAVGSV